MASRKQKRDTDSSAAPAPKRQKTAAGVAPAPAKLPQPHVHHAGAVALTFGQNCMGQLGVGMDISERKKPALIKGVLETEEVVQVAAGGMHCAVVTASGKVVTWGCNDQNALGRVAADDDAAVPGFAGGLDGVTVVHVSAGDSHTAALTSDGRVFAAGCFRDSNGILGFSDAVELQVVFAQVYPPAFPAAHGAAYAPALQVVSGADHIAILTGASDPLTQLYTLGCPAQGQLGRVAERFTERDSYRDKGVTPASAAARRATAASLQRFLLPHAIPCKLFKHPLTGVFAGSWSTMVLDSAGNVFGTGLNNFTQLGLVSPSTVVFDFKPAVLWAAHHVTQLAGSQHHTLALTRDGGVLAVGRGSEGQLGVPRASFVDGKEEIAVPAAVPALAGKKVVAVSTGSACSYAVLADGTAYAWGFGENLQLGTGDDADQYEPVELNGKQLEGKNIIAVDAGGQHSIMVAAPKQS